MRQALYYNYDYYRVQGTGAFMNDDNIVKHHVCKFNRHYFKILFELNWIVANKPSQPIAWISFDNSSCVNPTPGFSDKFGGIHQPPRHLSISTRSTNARTSMRYDSGPKKDSSQKPCLRTSYSHQKGEIWSMMRYHEQLS